MAELFSYLIPNLSQGISQQPDAQRDPSQAEAQINAVSSLNDGLRKRDPSQALALVSATPLGNVYIHSLLRDAAEKYLAIISATGVQVFDLAGAPRTVNAPSGYGYLTGMASAAKDIRATTIADYTFISNVKKNAAMKTSLAPPVARANHEALIWIKAANYGQTYDITVNGVSASIQTSVAAVITSGGITTEYRISAAGIAEAARVALGSPGGATITRGGSVLHVTSASPITLSARDARSNADIAAITKEVQSFTDLPTVAPVGYQVEVVGDPSNKYDGYYVKFVGKTGGGTFGEGTWEETVSPGVEYLVDEVTMPHILVRLPSGAFYFGPANGSTQETLVMPTWGGRGAGDYETAPDPSFIGKPINDIFIYKNRLGLLADESVVLSRAAEFFEFFPETVIQVLDSDPIDIAASSTRVSVLRHAVPYQDELILFSDQHQFRLGSSDTTLTPESAEIAALTQYDVDTGVKPVQTGAAVVFAQRSGDWTQFREFSLRGSGTSVVADAQSLTEYCSAYVPIDIFRLAANDTGNAWYAISSAAGYTDRIYTHKFFFRNSGSGPQRAQSSWSFWQLGGAAKILQILCIEEVLYLLVEYPNGRVWLEKMQVSDQLTDPASPGRPMLLDRRVSTTTATPAAIRVANGTYDATAQTTTWTLPYAATVRVEAWSGFVPGQDGGILLGVATSGTTITARGDWRSKAIWFGERYTMAYTFTRFKLIREIGGGKVAANVTRTQLRHAKIRFEDTPYFRARVTPEGRATATYEVDRAEPSDKLSGVFHIPLLCRGENCLVELVNDTPNPCSFSTLEWIGLITGKARSMQ